MFALRLAATLMLATLAVTRLPADDGIFVMTADGASERKVVQVEGVTTHSTPRWSHDGRRLAFCTFSDATGDQKLYVVDVDGANLREVADGGLADWSPDDKQLVFFSEGGKLDEGVWVQNLDGSGREWLAAAAWPRWSPDGGRLAICDEQNLKLLDLASGQEQLLVDAAFAQRPGGFDWSHDGKRLAVISRRQPNGPRELFILATDDGQPELTPRHAVNGSFGGHVSWSPDDKQLIMTVDSFIHVLDVEGNGAPKRLGGQPEKSRDPAFSPDGKWIAFARRPR